MLRPRHAAVPLCTVRATRPSPPCPAAPQGAQSSGSAVRNVEDSPVEPWERLIVVCAVIAGAAIIAKLVDMRMARRQLPPVAATRYRVLRRSLMGVIIFIGV